ncbi:winged helix-turn-helix transcriptional regulator [Haloterrigena sp. SYSU A558-1]|uniref:Winged helix-turn-helix transcriptional regulator n=1 Tax=Haloterrigena gelatinilytica TaxID=2741724 RepID=A0ABX2LHX2_9EURY|nr:winged helix-turn-helix domain-containing protein [Haloterrigena gelatinilytica]NUC75050.1 winged helix-turn-helix transcriptional regulator [Haloterrigena gelatinilytica]
MEHAPTIDTEQIGIDLRDVDVEILELLAEGRCTPRYLSKQIGVVQQYISQRLTRLIDHELVERVDRGLYELDCEVTHDE